MSAPNKSNDSSSRGLPLEAVNAHESMETTGMLCVKHFNRLTDLLRASDHSRNFERHISAVAIQDEFGRFKVWAANIGALQPGSKSSSLEHRLREATKVKDHVIKLLRDLNHSLTECISIVSGERPQSQSSPSEPIEEAMHEEFSELSDSSGSGGSLADQASPTSELQQLFLAIAETVTSLLKLSISIRRSTPRDRYARVASLSPLEPSFDINHVYEKYPRLRSKPWLVEKLGRAITRRRDFLRYRERHHEKLADSNVLSALKKTPDHHKPVSTKPGKHTISAGGGPKMADVASSSADRSRLASTLATTYIADSHNLLETVSHAGLSEISDITSVVDDHDQEARPIPDPPKDSAGAKPFECPYCYTIQVVRKPSHWKKHVLSDLEPYVCTFENCSAHLFQSRREWARHEHETHQREWRCSFCSLEHFTSAKSLDDHMSDHQPAYTREQTSSMQSLSEHYPQVAPMSACIFCDWPATYNEGRTSHSVSGETADLCTDSRSRSSPLAKKHELSELQTACPVVPIEQFQKHVGHHLEQLALFALPPSIKESSQTSSNVVAMSHLSRGSDEESVSKTSARSSSPVNSDPLSDLYVALTRGDLALVRKLLQGGADPNVRSPQGAGLLQVAAVFGVLEALEILLDAGADPNAQGGEYGNALQAIAAYDDHKLDALRLLLGAGADINMKGGKFGHALVAAAATELLPGIEESEPTWKVIQVLLEFGADVNADGWMYGTALGASVARKDYDSVRILLEQGADVDARRSEFCDLLVTASAIGHHLLVQILLDKGAVNAHPRSGYYALALQEASAKGHEQVVRLLLDKGADVNAVGGTALQAAAAKGHEAVVRLLLDKGADVNAVGSTALAAKGHEALVRLLLDEGADINAVDVNWGTALQAASAKGHEQVVRLLLDKGADINMLDIDGGTALQAASAKDHKQVVQMLLERGADPNPTRADQSRVLLQRLNTHDLHATQQPEQPSSPLYFQHWAPPDSQNKSKDKEQHLPEAESRSS